MKVDVFHFLFFLQNKDNIPKNIGYLKQKELKIILSKKITFKDIYKMKFNYKKVLDSSMLTLFNDLNDR